MYFHRQANHHGQFRRDVRISSTEAGTARGIGSCSLRTGLTGICAAMLLGPAVTFSQNPPPAPPQPQPPGNLVAPKASSGQKTIEIYQGTARTEASSTPRPPAPSPGILTPPIRSSGNAPSVPGTPAATSERPPLPAQAVEMAMVLARQSTDTFERGLLPLGDYLEQMRFVTYVEQRYAAERNQQRNVIAAAERHVAQLQHAAELLERFRQPAAKGWEADTLLARAATEEAQAELARLQGEKALADAAEQRFQTLAMDHLRAREFDTQVLGIGSLPTMAAAIEMVEKTAPSGDTKGDEAERRERILLTTERWHADDAGIGRADAVDKARVEADKSRGNVALVNRDAPRFVEAIQDAEQASRDLFQTRLEFYHHGTASLADLTNALLVRNRVHQVASSQEGLFTQEMDTAWEKDLREVVRLADGIEDHRGRNAPDIQFVTLLNLVDATDHNRAL